MTQPHPLLELALECMRSGDTSDQVIDLTALRSIEQSVAVLPSIARARWLLAQLACAGEAAFVQECIDEVAKCDEWPLLLTEIVSRLPPASSVIDIAAGVLSRRAANHPLAATVGSAKQVRPAFDMIDDGTTLCLRVPDWCSSATQGYLLSVDAPEQGCTAVTIASDGQWLLMKPTGPDDWLERWRMACPAALLVTI